MNLQSFSKQTGIVIRLLRYNFIPKRKLSLFFIGVFIISLITTVMVGYVTGIQQKNYFFPDSPNVLILYDKKATTPITGYIEASFAHDLKEVNGIQVTSPEIYSTGVIAGMNKPAILHGITQDYSAIHPIKILSGINIFANNNSNLDSVMVGVQLAKLLGLKVNTTIQFNSALKEVSRRFFIAGIFQTNSPADEEIFSSLSNAIGFSWVPDGFVTLIQVKFDPSILSKTTIETLISNQVKNSFSITQKNLDNIVNVNTLNVKVYGYGNRLITTFDLTTDKFNLTLPFGLYEISIHSNEQDFVNTFNYLALKNESKVIPLVIGYQTFNLSMTVFYNNAILNSYNLTIFDQFTNKMSFDNIIYTNYTETLPLYANRNYFVVISYQNISRNFYYSAIANKNVTIILNTGLLFQLANSTTSYIIYNFHYSIYNATTNNPIQSPVHQLTLSYFFFDLEPGNYKVVFSKGSYYSYHNVTITDLSPQFHYFTLGLVNVTFIPYNSNYQNLTWKIFDNGTLINETNSTGKMTFTVQSFHSYLVQLLYKNQTNSFYMYPQSSMTQNVYLNDSYYLQIEAYNGTDKNKPGVPFATVSLSTGTSFLTNGNGSLLLKFSQMEILNVNISSSNAFYVVSVTSLNKYGTIINAPLGDSVHVVITSKTQSGIIIPNQNVTIYYKTLKNVQVTTTFTTGQDGIANLYLPLSETIGVITNTSQNYFTGTTANYYEIDLLYPLFTNITIHAVDLNNQTMTNVYFKLNLENSLAGITSYSGYCDSNGLLNLNNVLLGNYTLFASYKDLTQQITISVDNSTTSFTIKFYTSFQKLNSADYLHYNSFRNVKIDNSSQYFQTFLQTTFGIFLVTLIIMVFITIFLMFLSMESIITFPLYQHKSEINSLRLIGATEMQVSIVLSLRLAIYSFFGSLAGILTSGLILFSISAIGESNFGGLIFKPKIDPFFTLLSIVFISTITFIISFWYLKKSLLPTLIKKVN